MRRSGRRSRGEDLLLEGKGGVAVARAALLSCCCRCGGWRTWEGRGAAAYAGVFQYLAKDKGEKGASGRTEFVEEMLRVGASVYHQYDRRSESEEDGEGEEDGLGLVPCASLLMRGAGDS